MVAMAVCDGGDGYVRGGKMIPEAADGATPLTGVVSTASRGIRVDDDEEEDGGGEEANEAIGPDPSPCPLVARV